MAMPTAYSISYFAFYSTILYYIKFQVRALQTQQASATVNARRISLSASIIREAKNQLKGLDPENMYIECPICHKRIKRLYHFQRHMRFVLAKFN